MYTRKALKHIHRAQEILGSHGFGASFQKGFTFNRVNNVLHVLAFKNQDDFVFKPEHVALIDQKSWNNTPIMLALKCGNLKTVSSFVNHMGKIVHENSQKVFNVLAAKDSYGITFTSLVCALRLYEVFKRIREIQEQVPPKTPDIEKKDLMKYTPSSHDDVDWHEYFANQLCLSSDCVELLLQYPLYEDEVNDAKLVDSHLHWDNLCPQSSQQDCYTYFPGAWALSSILIFHLRDFVANAIDKNLDFSDIDAARRDIEKRRMSFNLIDHFVKWRNANQWGPVENTAQKNPDLKWTCS